MPLRRCSRVADPGRVLQGDLSPLSLVNTALLRGHSLPFLSSGSGGCPDCRVYWPMRVWGMLGGFVLLLSLNVMDLIWIPYHCIHLRLDKVRSSLSEGDQMQSAVVAPRSANGLCPSPQTRYATRDSD